MGDPMGSAVRQSKRQISVRPSTRRAESPRYSPRRREPRAERYELIVAVVRVPRVSGRAHDKGGQE